MEASKDIRIGKEKWVKWIDFDEALSNPIEIDTHITPLKSFFKNLETECTKECCGIDAFSFWPSEIIKAAEDYETKDLINSIDNLVEELKHFPDEVISSVFFNQIISKSMFVNLLNHVRHNLTTT
ncbi:DUF6331 family protein [Owenweeksia hongkongensis]|uniref:DUF6331 family protein n=1 Tax=Owenweeksia hongkongensis TaxID=253245 RepID=UPI003A8F03A9